MNLSMTKVEFIFHFGCLITRNEEAISPITRSIDDFIRSTISTAFNTQQSLRQCLLLFGFWWLCIHPNETYVRENLCFHDWMKTVCAPNRLLVCVLNRELSWSRGERILQLINIFNFMRILFFRIEKPKCCSINEWISSSTFLYHVYIVNVIRSWQQQQHYYHHQSTITKKSKALLC